MSQAVHAVADVLHDLHGEVQGEQMLSLLTTVET